jgi:hypothetical protein
MISQGSGFGVKHLNVNIMLRVGLEKAALLCVLLRSEMMETEAGDSSVTLVPTYQTTRSYIPQD